MESNDYIFDIALRSACKEIMDNEVSGLLDNYFTKLRRKKKLRRTLLGILSAACIILTFSYIPVIGYLSKINATPRGNGRTAITLESDTEHSSKIYTPLMSSSLPDSWNFEIINDDSIVKKVRLSDDNLSITITKQIYIRDFEYYIDSRSEGPKEISIRNNITGFIYRFGGNIKLYFVDDYVYIIEGENIEEQILIDIAESLR